MAAKLRTETVTTLWFPPQIPGLDSRFKGQRTKGILSLESDDRRCGLDWTGLHGFRTNGGRLSTLWNGRGQEGVEWGEVGGSEVRDGVLG